MRFLFSEILDGKPSWGRIFQSLDAFRPLAAHILEREHLPVITLTNLTPGTNAVFHAGGYVLKIFAPPESGFYVNDDYNTELFGLRRAEALGIPVSGLVACGAVQDRYLFRYMVLRYVAGDELGSAMQRMSDVEKHAAGAQLRAITNTLNTPRAAYCRVHTPDSQSIEWNGADAITTARHNTGWEAFPDTFRTERLAYIHNHAFESLVYVHGDLTGENIIIDNENRLYLLDFADAVYAPIAYEHALVACAFYFDPPFLQGYFGDTTVETVTQACFDGLLLHAFGEGIVIDQFGKLETIRTLDDLRAMIRERVVHLF